MKCCSMKMSFDPCYKLLNSVCFLLPLSVTVLVLWNQFCVPLFDPPWRVSPYQFDHFQHVWVSTRNVLWICVRIQVSPYSLYLTCLGVNTQRFVDVCPDTGLRTRCICDLIMFLLIKSVAMKLGTFRVSSLHFVTSLPVLDNWVLGFSSIRWMSLLLPAISESKSHIHLSL